MSMIPKLTNNNNQHFKPIINNNNNNNNNNISNLSINNNNETQEKIRKKAKEVIVHTNQNIHQNDNNNNNNNNISNLSINNNNNNNEPQICTTVYQSIESKFPTKDQLTNALHKAIYQGNDEQAQSLALTGNYDLNHEYTNDKNQSFGTPLSLAAKYPPSFNSTSSYISMINTFLDMGAFKSLNIENLLGMCLGTPIEIAMMKGNDAFILTVLRHPKTPYVESLKITNYYLTIMGKKDQDFIKGLQKKAKSMQKMVQKK